MATVTDTVSPQLERVAPKMVELYNRKGTRLSDMIDRAGAERVEVSRYLYRMPLEQYSGGVMGKLNMDGGAFPQGTSLKSVHVTGGFIATSLSYRWTDEQESTSGTSKQSVVNVVQRILANALPGQKEMDNISLHTSGNGVLTNSASAVTGTTQLTFAGATDRIGINRLWEGMAVDIWDTTLATKRAPAAGTAPTTITTIDYNNKIVTLSQSITALAATDRLTFFDIDEYGPATPTSFSSTWPGGGLTSGPGLTGDSFRHGLPYANDSTTSNYFLGKLKSDLPQLLPAYQDGTGQTVSFEIVQRLLDQQIQKRGEHPGMKGIWHMKQRLVIGNAGIGISGWNRGQTPDKMPDLMPNNSGYNGTYMMCGVPFQISHRQPQDRIDLFVPSDWMRVQTQDIHFKKNGTSGGYKFPVYDANGNLTTQNEIHVVCEFDWATQDPGKGGYSDGLTVI
jgi:hypothetical protein